MFLRCSYFWRKISPYVLINMVLIKKKPCRSSLMILMRRKCFKRVVYNRHIFLLMGDSRNWHQALELFFLYFTVLRGITCCDQEQWTTNVFSANCFSPMYADSFVGHVDGWFTHAAQHGDKSYLRSPLPALHLSAWIQESRGTVSYAADVRGIPRRPRGYWYQQQ